MNVKHIDALFSQADQEAIESAVAETEKLCSIEVVPYVIQRADAYEHTLFKACALGALFGYMVDIVAADYFHAWTHNLNVQFFWIIGGSAAFMLLRFLSPAFERFLIGKSTLRERVEQKSEILFLEEEVFATKGRTGILLLVSLFEHQVTILCDSGVYSVEEPAFWKQVSDTVARGMHLNHPKETFLEAISMITQRMKEKNFKPGRDENEISNRLRMEK